MKNKNKEYWEKRQLAREELSFNKGTEAYKEYVKILSESKKGIENKIAQLYAKYQQEVTKLGVDKIQANKLLRGTEYKEWRYNIGKYVEEIEKLKKSNPVEFRKMSVELETLAYRSRISRLDSLKAGVDYELIQAGEKIKGKVTDTLTDVYENTYTSFVEDLNFKKGVISSSTIKMALEQEWSGANYSSRIWSNIDNLAKAIKNEVIVGLNKGINYRTMSQNIAKKFDTSYKNAERLVRTETAHIQNQATLMGYKDSGVVKYEFLAVLDSRTSHTCASLNGEVFKTENAMEGENYPPMHPHCYDTETEVYTNNGWKYFKHLENEDLVYTINTETLIPEWQKPINYISRIYIGKMISYKNHRFDLMITPKHNILIQNMDNSVKNKSWKLKEARSVGRKSKNRMLAGMNWIGENKEFEILGGRKVEIKTYLKFMAYWLADGSCTKNRGNYDIKIAQCNNGWMYEELKDFPFKIYKCKESLMLHDKELGKEMKSFGKCTNKYIPENIKNLSPELIRIFLVAYSKTDGHKRKGKIWKEYQFDDSIDFFTTSNKLAGDLGELILKVGGRPSYHLEKSKGKKVHFRNGVYTINNNLWRISWNKQIHSYLSNMEIKDIFYNDYVYCVEVKKYNTLLVRRNGKICWSGNCRSTTVPYEYADSDSVNETSNEELKNEENEDIY